MVRGSPIGSAGIEPRPAPVIAWAVALVWTGGLVAACDSARDPLALDAATADLGAAAPSCRACHGSAASPAPPRALNGKTATTERGVGAHATHLTAGPTHAAIACETCHVVPSSVWAAGHLDAADGRASVTFSGAALAGGATPTWDPATATCSATACHGAGLKLPGPHSAPVWTRVDGSQRTCGSCHGAPPPAPHPQSQACAGCHADTAGPGVALAALASHNDGKVDVRLAPDAPCAACHPAAPTPQHPAIAQPLQPASCAPCHASSVGLDGGLLPGGTHRNGVGNVQLRADAPCTSCHANPPPLPHPVALKPSAGSPCAACHAQTVDAAGKLLPAGLHRNGAKDVAFASQDCGTCHDAPPAGPKHPKMLQCARCHPGAPEPGAANLRSGGHLNGKLEVAIPTQCDACHGKAGSAAPPPDVNGKTDPALASVGAHAAHLSGKAYSAGGIACAACHELPATVDAPGHLAGTLQSVVFPSGLGTWKGTAPKYEPTTQTCSSVYCHGATMDAPAVPAPVWTQQGLGCSGCHGLPPGPTSGHPPGDPVLGTKACAQCHKGTVKPDGSLDLLSGKHANGKVDP